MQERGDRDELVGTRLGGYSVGPAIGAGGTGVVHEGHRSSDGAPVAIKMLRPEFASADDLARRLLREAEVSAAVRHPGLARVFDVGILGDGSPFVVMERVKGESLAWILARHRRLPPEPAVRILLDVLSILGAAHDRGFTHRDVKPEHVIVGRNRGNELVVRLLDFGVCSTPTQPLEERESERGRVYGTPTYVSPEQAAGEIDVDGRADVFSSAVVLYEALTGAVPFKGHNVAALLVRILREDATPVRLVAPWVSPELSSVMARGLARVRSERYQSAEDFRDGLLDACPRSVHADRDVLGRLAAQPWRVAVPVADVGLRPATSAPTKRDVLPAEM
ncbi:MAG: serine/threonine protein kinase [Deltaproteobacteria bacterium]|nr:serine/threonine protein kinase [Deltaproteobacteria bacterium]